VAMASAKIKRHVNSQIKKTGKFVLGWVGQGARTAPLMAGARRAGPSNARILSRDVVGEASCGGSEYSASRIPASSYLAGSI